MFPPESQPNLCKYRVARSATKNHPYYLPITRGFRNCLDGKALDLVTHSTDLARELTALVTGDASGDDRAADTAGAAEVHLAAHVDVGDVLVFRQEWDVEDNRERLGVGGEDNELGYTAVQRLRGLVGSLLELTGVCCVVSILLGSIVVKQNLTYGLRTERDPRALAPTWRQPRARL